MLLFCLLSVSTSQDIDSLLADSGIEGSSLSIADGLPGRKSSKASDSSSIHSGDSSSPRTRRNKKKFIKNIKPEAFKRPSAFITSDHGGAQVGASVAIDKVGCSLVGYRKMNTSTSVPVVQLGTLSPDGHETIIGEQGLAKNALFNAVSMPTLLAKGHINLINSGSMPELCTSASQLGNAPPDIVAIAQAGISSGSEPNLMGDGPINSSVGTDKAYIVSGNMDSQNHFLNGLEKPRESRSVSESPSDSSNQNIENGYVSSNSEQDKSEDSTTKGQDGVDYKLLEETLTKALGEDAEKEASGNKKEAAKEDSGEKTSENDSEGIKIGSVQSEKETSENVNTNASSLSERTTPESSSTCDVLATKDSDVKPDISLSTTTITTCNTTVSPDDTSLSTPSITTLNPEETSLSTATITVVSAEDTSLSTAIMTAVSSDVSSSQGAKPTDSNSTKQQESNTQSVINGSGSIQSQPSQDSDSGGSGMFTVMELLKDEFEKTEKKKAAHAQEAASQSETDSTVLGSQVSLQDVKISEDKKYNVNTGNSSRGSAIGIASVTKLEPITTQPRSTSFSSIISSSASSQRSMKEKEQKLVSPVGDNTIK